LRRSQRLAREAREAEKRAAATISGREASRRYNEQRRAAERKRAAPPDPRIGAIARQTQQATEFRNALINDNVRQQQNAFYDEVIKDIRKFNMRRYLPSEEQFDPFK
jgi:hypothetical protein